MDQQEIENEVASIRENRVSERSRDTYRRSYVKFIKYVVESRLDLVPDEFSMLLASDSNNSVKSVMKNFPRVSPINFDLLTAADFISWLVTVRKKDGTKPGNSTYNGLRTSLFNLFRDYGAIMSRKMEGELKDMFKGLKRTTAMQIAQGEGKIKSGKDPLSFSLYRFLAMEMLKEKPREYVFYRFAMIFAWNLMSRIGSALGVCYSHMEWTEDAMCVYFAQMKNDQLGERPRDPRHIYVNPLMPEICPVLALGIYWMVQGFDKNNVRLFPGQSQYDRFRKGLGQSLVLSSIADELERRGMEVKDVGAHSTRKGASTYCASGSTACPSAAAINLRAGWALGGVQDTYLRYEAAGDMYVGRTVTGLPSSQPEFAILPPQFIKGNNDNL